VEPEQLVVTKSGKFPQEDIDLFAALIFAESSRTNECETRAIAFVFKERLREGKTIREVAYAKKQYASVTGHGGKGSREFRAFLGKFEKGEATGLKEGQPQTMEDYAEQIEPSKKGFINIAKQVLNEELTNPVKGAIGQGGMIDLFSLYPKKDKKGKYQGKAKDAYWKGVKVEKRYVQIGDSVFVFKDKKDVPVNPCH
jgi:hypothetical protein